MLTKKYEEPGQGKKSRVTFLIRQLREIYGFFADFFAFYLVSTPWSLISRCNTIFDSRDFSSVFVAKMILISALNVREHVIHFIRICNKF